MYKGSSLFWGGTKMGGGRLEKMAQTHPSTGRGVFMGTRGGGKERRGTTAGER